MSMQKGMMMKTVQREIVSALIFSADGKLLMGMKDPKQGGVYTDCWHIPGGGVERGESLEEALVREIKEEVGLDVSLNAMSRISDDFSDIAEKIDRQTKQKYLCEMHFHVFKVQLSQPKKQVKLQLNDDLVKVEWVNIEDLKKYKLTPPSIKLFAELSWL